MAEESLGLSTCSCDGNLTPQGIVGYLSKEELERLIAGFALVVDDCDEG